MVIRKRGLSPVIATVMLIVLGLVLVMIIFVWARSWIGEAIQKDMGNGPEAIETFCKDVGFNAEARKSDNSMGINNIGNVPLYGIEIVKKSSGSVENIGGARFGNGLSQGRGDRVNIPGLAGVTSTDELIVIPVLAGETNEQKKAHICDEEFGKIADII